MGRPVFFVPALVAAGADDPGEDPGSFERVGQGDRDIGSEQQIEVDEDPQPRGAGGGAERVGVGPVGAGVAEDGVEGLAHCPGRLARDAGRASDGP